MPKLPEDYYTLLGLRRSVTQDEIRHAYLKAAKRLHPDKNVDAGETEIFLDVQQAYQMLSNPARRAAYDATLPAEEDAPTFISHRIQLSRKTLSTSKESQLVYLLVDLAPSERYAEISNSVPLNLCIILDCSTSMKGENLETVKETAIQLIRKLKPHDIFSVVTFNDRAEVVIPANKQANLHKMENFIRPLNAGGGTEILKGLQAGLEEVKRYRSPKYLNHIILLTDGHTYGDEQACYALASEAAQNRIGISCMGIGSDWNDVFLDQLANLTAGHCMLVSNPGDIERFLTEKFENLSNTFAENVTLEYTVDEGVSINYAFRLQPETDPLSIENPIRLGPIFQGTPLTFLIEFVIRPQDISKESITLLHGNIEVSASAIHAIDQVIPINLVLSIKAEAQITDTPSQAIIQALSKLSLYRIQEKARNEVTAGNYSKATEHLKKLATRLLAQGERSLAKTVILEIEQIETENTYSEQGQKRIKYGTRALMLLPEEKKS
ncbi:MAG: VWA domain-containing protein [Chloroflexi bacterium]|nr:VWA domain-containing protein [Chloroflexota bacterium]